MIYCKTCNKIYSNYIKTERISPSYIILYKQTILNADDYKILDIKPPVLRLGEIDRIEYFCPIKYTSCDEKEHDSYVLKTLKLDGSQLDDKNIIKLQKYYTSNDEIDLSKLSTKDLVEIKFLLENLF